MQALIDTAIKVLSIIQKNDASKEELAQAASLLSDALNDTGDQPLNEIIGAASDARRFIEHEHALLPGTSRLEDGRTFADAPDGSRWTKGAPRHRGTYWFLVPFVERFKGAGVFKGFYREFEFEKGVSLDKYGHVSDKELEELWHLPLLMPEIPNVVAFRAEARGALIRATQGPEALRIRDGVDD